MINWLTTNSGTLLVSAILITVITLIIINLIRQKKHGISSCGCGCSNCPMSCSCHKS